MRVTERGKKESESERERERGEKETERERERVIERVRDREGIRKERGDKKKIGRAHV